MNDLINMIQNEDVSDQELPTDIPEEEVETTPDAEETNVQEQPQPQPVEEELDEVESISLSEWFWENKANFPECGHLKLSVKGVDAQDELVFSVPHPKGGLDDVGHERRTIEIIKDAKVYKVLDLPGISMDVYGNGFKILYNYDDTIFLMCYGTKTGLNVMFCIVNDERVLPYASTKLKKRGKTIKVIPPNLDRIEASFDGQLDTEALQIMYPQVQKQIAQITTKDEAINWFLDRKSEIRDINHMMQIDQVIYWLIS